MSPRSLIALIEAVDNGANSIVDVAQKASASAASDLISARRTFSADVHVMNRTIDEHLSAPLSRQESSKAAELLKSYRDRSNRARAAVSNHQAKWSAVEILEDLSHYRSDLGLLHADQMTYRQWLKAEFIPQASALIAQPST